MGAWNVGAFDNDRALDTLAMLKDVNGPGVNAFLWTALDSTYEEIVVLAIAIIDIVSNGKEDKLTQSFATTILKKDVLSLDIKDIALLKRESYQKVCYLIEQGNVTGWKNWIARKKYLVNLKDSLKD